MSDARYIFVLDCGVVLDRIAAIGADDKKEGAGHVAFGIADAGVEIEFSFFGTIEAHSVYDTIFFEILREF